MSTATRAMRRFSARLLDNLDPRTDEDALIPAIAQALSQLRGRPVRLRQATFPPRTASGVWIDRAGHDLIVYEENTDPEHQHVIIGHEAWHMFQGHGGSATDHGPAASRSGRAATYPLAQFVAAIAQAADTDLAAAAHGDAALHFAARTDARQLDEELEAELFGFRFATDLHAALKAARMSADPRHPAGRIQASMAHRFPHTPR